MLTALLLTLAAAPPTDGGAADALTGWTRTASAAEAVATVQARRFEKSGQLIARLGLSYLARGDLRQNPGLRVELSYYLSERWGLDLVSGTVYLSSLDASARAVRRATGYLPDSQKPIAWVGSGARYAFAYGKLLIEATRTVVHLDAGLGLRLGVMITDRTANPGAELGLSSQIRVGELWLFCAEVGGLFHYENRTAGNLAAGAYGALSAGVRW